MRLLLALLGLVVLLIIVALLVGDSPQIFWELSLMLGLAIALFGVVRLVRFLRG